MINWQGTTLIITIIVMMALVFYITRFISTARYGLYSSIIKGYIRGNIERREWINEYSVYYWSFLLNICLIITILALCGSVGEMKFLNRPELALIVSVPLWYSIFRCIVWYQNKLMK